jgi:NAD(P)H dehydrogenase (quinone)
MPTLGVTGASGQLARIVLRELLQREPAVDVVAVTRTPDTVTNHFPTNVRVRRGDFNDAASLGAAFAGIDRLLIIPGSDLVPDVRPRQHAAAVSAATTAGVKHIIYVSSIGARPGPPDGILETHWATEQSVIASRVPWTLIRMNVYIDSQIDGLKRAVASGTYAAAGGAPSAYVTRDDLGAMSAAVLGTAGHEGVTYHASGPASVTHAQLADAASRATGRAVTFVPLSPEEASTGLAAAGLPAFLVEVIGRFQQAGRDGAFDLVSGDIERLTGRRPLLATDFVLNALKGSAS